MSIKLETLPTDATLTSLETTIRQTEALGFELITLAKGVVSGQPSNTLTLRRLDPGNSPSLLTLQEVKGSLSLAEQEIEVNKGEAGAKKLISYAAVFVEGQQTNVAAYRG